MTPYTEDNTIFAVAISRITRFAVIFGIGLLILGEVLIFYDKRLSSGLLKLGIGVVLITPLAVLLSSLIYFIRKKNTVQIYLVLIISVLLFTGPLVINFLK